MSLSAHQPGRLQPQHRADAAPRRTRRCPRAAFSLVEVLIVAVILAIAAMVVTPRLGSADVTRLSSAVRLMVADLEYAQVESMAHADDPRVVVFNTTTGTYHIAPGTTPNTPITNPVGGSPYSVTFGTGRASQLRGVTISNVVVGGDGKLGFGAYGQLDQASSATITLSAGTRSITLTLDPITGESTVGPVQ